MPTTLVTAHTPTHTNNRIRVILRNRYPLTTSRKKVNVIKWLAGSIPIIIAHPEFD